MRGGEGAGHSPQHAAAENDANSVWASRPKSRAPGTRAAAFGVARALSAQAQAGRPVTCSASRATVGTHACGRYPMDLLIFDLDGTLIDSRLDLAHAVNATRAHMGMERAGVRARLFLRGQRRAGADPPRVGRAGTEAEVEEGLEFFLEYYREHALDYTRLYPGVKESLDRLSGAGKRMAVLTNKPVRMSKFIVEGLGVAARFFQVYGGNSFDFKKPNPIGVETLMRETGMIARAHGDGGR